MSGRLSPDIQTHSSEPFATSEEWLASGIQNCLVHMRNDKSDLFARRLKALCEIAFLEYHVTRRPSARIREALLPALEKLWNSGQLLSLWRYNLAHANLFLPLGSAAIVALPPTPSQTADVELLVRITRRYSKERLPFRTLDLLHGLHKITNSEDFYSEILQVAQRGCLGTVEYLQDFDLSDDYALTHTIFYVTDFGSRPWPPLLPDTATVSAVLDVLSLRAEKDHNLDLLAEYLLARQMIGCREGRYQREIELLESGCHGTGYWPGPADLTEKLRGKVASPMEAVFFEHYHTTLVAREGLLRAGE